MPEPAAQAAFLRRLRASLRPDAALAALLLVLSSAGCRRDRFPAYPANYFEFAYVANSAADTVTVLDLVYLRQDHTLSVGKNPVALAVNPVRNEVYAVNSGSGTITVINTELNRVDATIGVQQAPSAIAVSADGKRAYVTNSASNTVSVVDLDSRRQIGWAATGEGPAGVRVSPDNRTLVVSNRVAGSISVYGIQPAGEDRPLQFRESFDGCPGASDVVIEADSPDYPTYGAKAFVACTAGHQVLDVWLAADPASWRGKQDSDLTRDHKLALLDVGQSPTRLALKPDNGEVFSTNADADSISEISTWTNEVEGTYVVGAHPSHAVISQDGGLLWAADSGADSVSLYSIADGRMVTGVRTGPRPTALAYSTDEHILLVADSGSSDVAVIRTQANSQPALVTMLPAGEGISDLVVKSFTAKTPK